MRRLFGPMGGGGRGDISFAEGDNKEEQRPTDGEDSEAQADYLSARKNCEKERGKEE